MVWAGRPAAWAWARLRAAAQQPRGAMAQHAWVLARRPWHRTKLYRATLGRRPPERFDLEPADPWPGDVDNGRAFLTDRIELEGRMLAAPTPFWRPDEADPAWLAALHGFRWVRDLRAVGSDHARRRARELMHDWLARHPGPGEPAMAWHPAPTGRRLAVWLANQPFLIHGAGAAFGGAVALSVMRQARHLSRVLPAGLMGAELIAAIKGLIFAGACVPQGRLWVRQGLELMETELDAQVLADGGHVSRTPSTHLDVLGDLIDIRNVLAGGNMAVPESLRAAIDSMAPVLKMLRHGDGGLAVFNGGHEGRPAVVEQALQQVNARIRAQDAAPQSGFQRLRAQRTQVIADAGPPPPPGHDTRAHAGILSFELSDGTDRVIVNCGALSGHPKWSMPLRATAAHSTLTLADTNAAEILAPAGGLGTRRPVHVMCRREASEGAGWLAMGHDGYRPLFNAVHARRLFLATHGDDLRGEDTVTGPPDLPFAVRFHVHPSVHVTIDTDGTAVLATPTGARWRLRAQGASLDVEPSIYLGSGHLRHTYQVVLTATTTRGDTVVKWALKRA